VGSLTLFKPNFPFFASYYRRLFRTLLDIGPIRLKRRIVYDIHKFFDSFLPSNCSLALADANNSNPGWRPVLRELYCHGLHPPASLERPLSSIRFSFLQQERQLFFPFSWNDSSWPRLWQFHLHYFDWARDWLEHALISKSWSFDAIALEQLLDHWISANTPGNGDGWNSYTISLRTRNWIWLFRCCPELISSSRLQSLWQQLRWLQSHPEHCHGGNHWIENLTALALGGLQFFGPDAYSMHIRALYLLEIEIKTQILSDGGHEERSACYHLLLLDRLVELGFAIALITHQRPSWLVSAIRKMASWASSVRLYNGQYPRFNDSPVDISPSLDEVVSFAQIYLNQSHCSENNFFLTSPLRRYLASSLFSLPESSSNRRPLTISPSVLDLPATGWTLLRPGYGWELIFKCGVPCPPHLPAHVHSDQLSFDLTYFGQPVISETGTSIYRYCSDRLYERSGAAHNVLQLGFSSPSGEIDWVEPVDVWGSFRAGRKALPRHRECSHSSDQVYFAAGSHNGFDSRGAQHHRRVQLSAASSDQITLIIEDSVSTHVPLYFRLWLHLSPSSPTSLLNSLLIDASSALDVKTFWQPTWFAMGLGHRLPSQSFCIIGFLPSGDHLLRVTLPLSVAFLTPS